MSSSIETIDFHGIPAIRLQTSTGAQATVSLMGAQVLSWIPVGGKERLFLSSQAVFDGTRSIRGGIPVCFPQFSGLGDLPKHGFLRTRQWRLVNQQTDKDFALISLEICDDPETQALWPFAFRAEISVGIDRDRLDIELEVENTGSTPFAFTGALHSYLSVDEVEQSTLSGLYGLSYRDAADGNQVMRDTAPELLVEAEVDRVYHQSARPLFLEDGFGGLGIQHEGFPDTVVWNPWEEKCATLPDMNKQDFRHMICVEAAIAQAPQALASGEIWWGRQSLLTNPMEGSAA
jgi:glucose-6-phosphate 1-epimerase